MSSNVVDHKKVKEDKECQVYERQLEFSKGYTTIQLLQKFVILIEEQVYTNIFLFPEFLIGCSELVI